MNWGLVLLVGLLCGGICLAIASAKGRNRIDAVFLGLLLGPVGVLIEACQRSRDRGAPGWYLDESGKMRHWNGHAWTR